MIELFENRPSQCSSVSLIVRRSPTPSRLLFPSKTRPLSPFLCAALLAFLWSVVEPKCEASETPFMVSANKQNVVFKSSPNDAFQFVSDTGWNMVQQLSRAEIREYLDIRAAQGFTMVQFIGTGHDWRAQKHYGWRPINGSDFSKPMVVDGPDNDWWDYIEWIINELEQRGMYAGFLPMWRQDFHSGRIVGEAECEAYGRFLGQRFREQNDRIIWFMGGDLPTDAFPLAWHRAVARGIAKGVSDGAEDYDAIFCSYHVAGRGDTLAFPEEEPFMDFNTIQSGHWNTKPYELQSEGVIAKCLRTQKKPCLDLEPMYEFIKPYATPAVVRHIIWWNVFEGAFGTSYGHGGVWHFGTYNRNGGEWVWDHPEDYRSPVAEQIWVVRHLLASRPGANRMSDLDPLDPATRFNHHRRICCLRDRDRTYLMVYTPNGESFRLRTDRLRGEQCHGWWYCPRTAKITDLGLSPNTGAAATFDPPGEPGENYTDSDWVLVLDDVSWDYPPPGSIGK